MPNHDSRSWQTSSELDLSSQARRLRDVEQMARDALNRGCADDLAAIDRLLARPLHKARTGLETEMLSLGIADPVLRRNTLSLIAREITDRCAAEVFANASVRFRARFITYASSLANAEQEFFTAAREVGRPNASHQRPPRQIAVPHIELEGDFWIVPQSDIAEIDRWSQELRNNLHLLLEETVDRTRLALLKRGAASVAHVRTLVRLMFTVPVRF